MSTASSLWSSARRFAPLRSMLAIAVAASGLASVSDASEPITLSTMRVALEDGVADVPALKSSALTLTAFHFGPWITASDGSSGFGIVLRHVRFSDVHLGVSILEKPDIPENPAQWKRYVNVQLDRLGAGSQVNETGDSTEQTDIPAILGWPTREADFTVQSAQGSAERIEKHVLSTGQEIGVAFVLLGTPDGVANAERDFRLLLARLTQR